MGSRCLPLLVWMALLVACSRASTDTPPHPPQEPSITGWNFDWDDNIFYMPTQIVLFAKDGTGERLITTAEFAMVREHIGKSGPYKDFETRDTERDSSFRFFRDDPAGKRNYFLEDIRRAIEKNDKPVWIGPSWDAFVFALSRVDTARHVTIITARGHSRDQMMPGLRYLKGKGYLRHLPPKENLYGVSHPALAGDATHPSAIKVRIMQEILDRFDAIPSPSNAPRVINRNGDGLRPLHLWGFSDDDYGNFATARDELAQQVNQGRWENTKITVLFTGIHDPHHQPDAVVLRPDPDGQGPLGPTRPRLAQEANEGVFSTLCIGAVLPDPAVAHGSGVTFSPPRGDP